MGLFDSLKKALGGGSKPETTATASPSQLLREAGLDPSGLKFGFGAKSISVSGAIASEGDREKILQVLSGLDGIDSVEDNMTVAEPEPAPPAPEGPASEAPAPEAPAAESPAAENEQRTYTVQPGDSLWKIAEEMYGNGSKYMKIFEANKDLLENPDKIFPGQELKIPDLED